MKYTKHILYACILLFTNCGSNDSIKDEPQPPTEPRSAVSIITRTDNPDGNTPLQAGLYMVNYNNGNKDNLQPTDNYVNNQLMTWDAVGWTLASPIYWSDMNTKADFFAYAPYQSNVANAREAVCSVLTDQTSESAFTQSDFLWGKVEGQSPNGGGISLIMSHVLSMLTVTVTAEAGFDEGELKASDVEVTFGGSKTEGVFDLATGVLTVSGSASDVKCLSVGDLSYKAVLLPQIVPFSNLIKVNWKGNLYTIQNSFKLESGRQYNLTVKLKKTQGGFDIGIAGWDIIGEDFGGVIGGN